MAWFAQRASLTLTLTLTRTRTTKNPNDFLIRDCEVTMLVRDCEGAGEGRNGEEMQK